VEASAETGSPGAIAGAADVADAEAAGRFPPAWRKRARVGKTAVGEATAVAPPEAVAETGWAAWPGTSVGTMGWAGAVADAEASGGFPAAGGNRAEVGESWETPAAAEAAGAGAVPAGVETEAEAGCHSRLGAPASAMG
jgi:hypothetical protein